MVTNTRNIDRFTGRRSLFQVNSQCQELISCVLVPNQSSQSARPPTFNRYRQRSNFKNRKIDRWFLHANCHRVGSSVRNLMIMKNAAATPPIKAATSTNISRLSHFHSKKLIDSKEKLVGPLHCSRIGVRQAAYQKRLIV